MGEAIELYEGVLARTPRPELQQAFGELYSAMGETAQAERWFDQALAGYLESAERAACITIIIWWISTPMCGKMARKRWPGRARIWNCGGISGRRRALAWALYRDGHVGEAMQWMDRALASGVRDAHLFAKAARINAAAGRLEKATNWPARSLEMNPHYARVSCASCLMY